MKVSSTFSIEIETLLKFNELLKEQNLKKSTVINQLIQEWLENTNGIQDSGDQAEDLLSPK